MRSYKDLHNYQLKAIEFSKANKKCALFVDLGMGKTIVVLTLIQSLLDEFETHKTLIIAPLRVANITWADEIALWDNINLKYLICTGSANNRISNLNKEADLYIINRENIPWLVSYYGPRWPFDCVIIDESTSFKSFKANRFKKLKLVLSKIDRLIELTATGAGNSLMDLWPQFYLLDGGARLGKTITEFRNKYFISDYMGYTWTLKLGAEETIRSKIKDIVFRLKASDYLEVPQIINTTVKVRLPASLKEKYEELKKDFVTSFDIERLSVFSAAAKSNKLLQFCNGAAYTDSNKNYVEIHDKKLEALAEIIECNKGENIIVAYNYRTDLIRIKKRFANAMEMDKEGESIEAWNNGKISLMLLHPASAGHGLNLQKGGHIIVWFGLTWSLENYQQLNGRLHRQGQKKPVTVVHIVCEGCIDEYVMKSINCKNITQEKLLQFVVGSC